MRLVLPRMALTTAAAAVLGLSTPAGLAASPEAQALNPIGALARGFNPKLREVEGRLSWLNNRLRTLATYNPKALERRFGWRAGYTTPTAAKPQLTLDLSTPFPISDIFVIPAQPRPGDESTLFPLEYRVETSLDADFSDAQTVYRTQAGLSESQDGFPRRHGPVDADARFIRLTVERGHFRGTNHIAAISELVVISGGEPISFNASVSANGSFDAGSQWQPAYAVDGRSPLGSWEGGLWSRSRGFRLDVDKDKQLVRWIIDLGAVEEIERVIAFPYTLPELGGPGMLPRDLRVHLATTPDQIAAGAPIFPGGESSTPAVFPFPRCPARFVIIESAKAFQIGPTFLQAMSEIEVWSNGRNLAAQLPVRVQHADREVQVPAELTDGHSNGLKIFPVSTWLMQMTERQRVEQEIDALSPIRHSLATETELNVAWGASLAIGLTLLIPVAIVERRRLVSRKQIDSLRKRIASDLHDDIGSNLGSISLIARSAKRDLERLHGPPEVVDDLDEVEVIARESSLAMRDIVWLLERQQDSIGDFVQRMRDSATRLLRDIDYTLTCASNRTALKMTLDAKRHLFLFYKEALHNVLKHAKATRVEIRVYDSRDRLVMEVRDNGVGLPADEAGRLAAVKKLNDRAQVLEGELEIESSPGEGTLLRLAVKRANLILKKAAA